MTQTDLSKMPIVEFLAATAGKTPTPGGGSVAGVAGAMGTALGEMALAFTQGKKAFAEHEADYAAIGRRLGKARQMFLTLLADDVAAYTLYQQALQADGPDKDERMQLALAAAIDVPREMTALCLVVLNDLASLATRCNKWLISDLAAGAVLAEATVRLSDFNVRINTGSYGDKDAAGQVCAASRRDCGRARDLLAVVETELNKHM
jgi:formiminotetrahydrofolate cyclodeaminase